MTEEQKNRIRPAGNNDCTFDGLPMHPHYRHFLEKAGFKDLSDIEEKTEEEFIEIINELKRPDGRPVARLKDPGTALAEDFKSKGVLFKKQ